MTLTSFSAQGRFSACGGRQCSFGFSAAAELAPRALARRSDSIAVPRLLRLWQSLGIPENPQAPLPKIEFADKLVSVILNDNA
jgi:hypothetical protein